MKCYCGSGVAYSRCCQPFITGQKIPPTAEALMRSRYSAYAQADIAYIEQTLKGVALEHFNAKEALQSARQITWESLMIKKTEQSVLQPNVAYVEFVAIYRDSQGKGQLHERSEFFCEHGRWYYIDGELY